MKKEMKCNLTIILLIIIAISTIFVTIIDIANGTINKVYEQYMLDHSI